MCRNLTCSCEVPSRYLPILSSAVYDQGRSFNKANEYIKLKNYYAKYNIKYTPQMFDEQLLERRMMNQFECIEPIMRKF